MYKRGGAQPLSDSAGRRRSSGGDGNGGWELGKGVGLSETCGLGGPGRSPIVFTPSHLLPTPPMPMVSYFSSFSLVSPFSFIKSMRSFPFSVWFRLIFFLILLVRMVHKRSCFLDVSSESLIYFLKNHDSSNGWIVFC